MRFRSLLLLLGVVAATAQQDHKSWKDYGSGADSSKYIALDQITKSNISQLKISWTYPTGDSRSYLFNPVIVDNVMFVLAKNSSLVALDAETGKEIWIHANLRGIAAKGINYWESKDRKDRRLIFQMNNFIEEIDARTGKSILTFGTNGLVNLKEGLGRDPRTIARIQSSNPGRIFENLILLGSSTGENYFASPGDLRAYDVITGKLTWSFHTIPHPGEFGYDTWPKDAWKYAGGANTWGEITLDEKRGIAYFPTGSSTYDIYGADRIGSDLFANCLLALDARTGKRLWHFQMVHHDLWDYDATSAPQLVTVRHDGKTVDAVAQASKQGFLYVFDRVTGKPLWPIEERPVPKSSTPGEQAWPTQPFPTAPPPFARQKMTPEDVNPFFLTAEERAAWKDRVASGGTGLFTPASLDRDTFVLPGARGGSNWGTTAANPTKGMVFVLTQDWPSIYRLAPYQPAGGMAGLGDAGPGQTTYQQHCQICHGTDRAGAGAVPTLAGIAQRLGAEEFRQVVTVGRGEMPAFPSLGGVTMSALYAYLANPNGQGGGRGGRGDPGPLPAISGPVVASGGAPGGLDLPARGRGQYGTLGGPDYPEGVAAPAARYYSSYGTEVPHIISPPWSSIVAYDLNSGTLKWKVALGEDQIAANDGGKDTGLLRGGEHHGIVVTSTGLVFANAKDGKIRAFDEETGKVLWSATLPAGTEGIPAMYQVNGRQYLVVSASSTVGFGRQDSAGRAAETTRGYVVFALPK
jgi:quinoprotein glucose dehydrogenase